MSTSPESLRMTLEDYLPTVFKNNQGIRLGESSVLSLRVHGNDSRNPGEIIIFIDKDAGRHYLNTSQANQVIHLDVFHEPAILNPFYLARNIHNGVEKYFLRMQEENRQEYTRQTTASLINTLSGTIRLRTSWGQDSVFTLASDKGRSLPPGPGKHLNHVHLLLSLDPKFYDSIIFITDSVEQSIQNQGFEIRKVERIVHCKNQKAGHTSNETGISLPGYNSSDALNARATQNRLQTVDDLAGKFGTVEDAVKFLESLTTTGNIFLRNFAPKADDSSLQQTLLELTNLNLVKKNRFTHVLTEQGRELRDFIRLHQKELEAHLRKSIRRYQITRHDYRTFKNSQLKSRKNQITNYKKVAGTNENTWLSEIAIPETIVTATTRSFLEGYQKTRIKKQDLRVYGKKSFAPIDTCLAVDCSGSMAGEKIKAVSFLARHFLLTAKEKVSVVAFQESDAEVVVPFTKNYQRLEEGLRSIKPEGLTPLAKGIVETVGLIKRKRARNPLLILITDGVPNFPLWTVDAQKDALKAAESIAENKIRFVCIGVQPNKDFMKELSSVGKGNLYIVDELDKNSLLDVVTREWEEFKHTR